jgi:hypothetical protein
MIPEDVFSIYQDEGRSERSYIREENPQAKKDKQVIEELESVGQGI